MNRYITLIYAVILLFLVGCNKTEKDIDIKKIETQDTNKRVEIKKIFSIKDYLSEDSLLTLKTEEIFNSLNDSERVGQMIMTSVGTNGKSFEIVNKLVLFKKVGGMILMGGSKDSFKSFINKFDSISRKINSIPLFYSIDAEPGFVESRIKGVPSFPSQSKIKSSQESDTIAKSISNLLKNIGINMNFAPVCDISSNKDIIGERSFGNDSKKIKELSIAFIKETQNNNIIATIKHFPGHGNVKGDSHKDMVYVDGELSELKTFHDIINSGVLAVMVGHIAVKNNSEYQTGGLPSSLSKKIITDLLRNKIGFKGLIITDALNMGAVTKIEKPSLKAALAGCDILLMPTDENKLIISILDEINKNQEFKKQVYESVKRIIRVKICLGLIKNE